MKKAFMREGTEGPRHDPYGWIEYTAINDSGTRYTLRVGGLGYYRLLVNNVKQTEDFDGAVIKQWESLTGMTIEQLEQEHYTALDRTGDYRDYL